MAEASRREKRRLKMDITIGTEYIIEHSRKGTFIGKVLRVSKEWLTVEITKGKAEYMSLSNNLMGRGNIGDILTIRISFCNFKEA